MGLLQSWRACAVACHGPHWMLHRVCWGAHGVLCARAVQVLRPDIMMDKLGRFWGHKNWKVRHGLLQFVAEAVCSTGEAVLAIPRDDSNWVLHKVIQLVGDPER